MGKRRDSEDFAGFDPQASPRENEGVREGDVSLITTRWGLVVSPEQYDEVSNPRSDSRNTLGAVRKRMCSHEGVLELSVFFGWLLVITAHVAQIWALWWFFWQHVVGDAHQRWRRNEPIVRLGLNSDPAATRAAMKRSPSLTASLTWHAAQRSVTANCAKTMACFAAWTIWLSVATAARRIFKRLMPAMVRNLSFNKLSGYQY